MRVTVKYVHDRGLYQVRCFAVLLWVVVWYADLFARLRVFRVLLFCCKINQDASMKCCGAHPHDILVEKLKESSFMLWWWDQESSSTSCFSRLRLLWFRVLPKLYSSQRSLGRLEIVRPSNNLRLGLNPGGSIYSCTQLQGIRW